MVLFLIKGLLRDRSRSLFPLLVVIAGVMLTVILSSWISGAQSEMIRSNARFDTGHVKIMSKAYAEQAEQLPNDLAYIGVEELLHALKETYDQLLWTPRIRFGGLIDIPDAEGETRSQGPFSGMALDLLSPDTPEYGILNIEQAVVRGRLPHSPEEILISDQFAVQMDVEPGDTATLISSTMYGSMAIANLKITGTVRFGITAMDRSAIIADLRDVQHILDMEDAAGEILGYFKSDVYSDPQAKIITAEFNARYENSEDRFSPTMVPLRSQGGLADYLDMIDSFSFVIVGIFVVIMSLVLWNAGLMGSLRRYGEFGVRLAIGEPKGHLYRILLAESFLLGTAGTLIGTAIGLAISYYLQEVGVPIGSMTRNASMLISNVMRARITPLSLFIGFIPGLLATFLGTSISGIGIYRRQTARLAKEMEV
jgi:putative ABC transport system permease protein